MSLGICLAGGGVKGAAHIGTLKALEEAGLEFDYISGTSSGSIVACLYACGYTPEDIYAIFKKYCKKIKYIDFLIILKLIFGVIFTGRLTISGLNRGRIIERLINKVCKEKNIENINQIKRSLLIPSVDLNRGTVYCFTSKNMRKENRLELLDDTKYIYDAPIGKAVRASCSYPGVFCPCKFDGKNLIDGGVRENVPWKETKAMGADKVIRSKSVSLLDTSKIDMLYNLGYEETKKRINALKKNSHMGV